MNTNELRPIGLEALSIDDLGARTAAIVQDINFSANRMMTGMVNLGEVLVTVKEKTDFGRYGNYLRFLEENEISERMAQQSVQAYKRFFDKPDVLRRLGNVSKLREILALPESQEEAFLQTHDVESMSVRQLKESVREAKGASKTMGSMKVSPSAQAREEAEKQGEAMEAMRAQMEAAKKQIEALEKARQEAARAYDHEVKAHEADKAKAERLSRMLDKSSEKRQDIENEMIALKRQMNRGQIAQQDEKDMTAEHFAQSVRQLMADCCEVPQMGRVFAAMSMDERRQYVRSADMLENYLRGVRDALNGSEDEEVYVR